MAPYFNKSVIFQKYRPFKEKGKIKQIENDLWGIQYMKEPSGNWDIIGISSISEWRNRGEKVEASSTRILVTFRFLGYSLRFPKQEEEDCYVFNSQLTMETQDPLDLHNNGGQLLRCLR